MGNSKSVYHQKMTHGGAKFTAHSRLQRRLRRACTRVFFIVVRLRGRPLRALGAKTALPLNKLPPLPHSCLRYKRLKKRGMVTVYCSFSRPSKLASGSAVTAGTAGLGSEPPLCNRARQALSGVQTTRRKRLVVARKTYVTPRAEINDIVEAYADSCVCAGRGRAVRGCAYGAR